MVQNLERRRRNQTVKFFIPAADSVEQEEQAYNGIKAFLGKELGAEFSDRRVYLLRWRHDGKEHVAEVGKTTKFNGELVIAILYVPLCELYLVCTPNRGVRRGMSILVGGYSVNEFVDFDSKEPVMNAPPT